MLKRWTFVNVYRAVCLCYKSYNLMCLICHYASSVRFVSKRPGVSTTTNFLSNRVASLYWICFMTKDADTLVLNARNPKIV